MAFTVSRDSQKQARPLLERVEMLQERIRRMQATRLETREIPTLSLLSPVLPGGSLRQGGVYAVDGSASLLMALLAGPSKAGAWCAAVGMPDFGVEAAAGFGIALERLVLVPDPGRQWLSVVAALVDVIPVVAVRPAARVAPGEAARLAARLHQHDATLIVEGPWPGSDARIGLRESRWAGLGRGHGHLTARDVVVSGTGHGGFGVHREARLWFPDHEQTMRPAEGVREQMVERGEAVAG